jgi:hypothetical protein
LQLLTDVNPGASVGRYLFALGASKIRDWLARAVAEAKVKARVAGISLGGAMTEHTVIAFPEWIETAYAFNPPALLGYEIRRWNQLPRTQRPNVYLFQNERDIVPYSGNRLGDGWKVFRTLAQHPPSPLPSHFQNFLMRPKHILLNVKIQPENRSFLQNLFTWMRLFLSIPLFALGTIMFITYLLITNLFKKKK